MSEPAWRAFTAEQQRAAFLVDRPVLAAAGAGAGKTAVMAVRYVACLLSYAEVEGLKPERILAVSFTREAAANLRARIERTLRTVIKTRSFPRFVEGEGITEAELHPTQIDHLRMCLRDLPMAPIATIDALCLQWVAEHAAILGRDPDLRPPENLAWAQVREQAWTALVADDLAREPSDLVSLVAAYGAHTVQRLVQRLGDQAAALPQPQLNALTGDAVELVRARRATMIDALTDAVVDAQQLPIKAKVLDKVRAEPSSPPSAPDKFAAWLSALSALSLSGVRDDAVKEVIGAIQDAVDFPSQRVDGKRPGTKERLAFASLAGLAAHDSVLEVKLTERATAFARLATNWLEKLNDCAARAHLAGFASVEAQALHLLDHPQVRRRLGTRYRHVLLDEAQDLNRLQGRLVEALQAGGGEQSARIFIVGDHRQSIYGFRHADPAIFAGWETSIHERGGIAATLAENFRSHPDLLQQVRGVFAQDALAADFRPADIKAGRLADDFKGRAGIQRGWRVLATREGQPLVLRANAIEASEAQARHLASLVATSIASGRRAEDHAVLLRTRGRMQLYAQALERAGIPYDTDFPGGLYDAQECHDIEAVLRLCVNPHDRRALAIALGGPWGAADAQDRTLMVDCLERSPAEGWNHAAAQAPIGELVGALRPILASEGVAPVIRRLIADERLTRRYGSLPLARRRLANLAHLAEEEQAAGIALDAPAFIARLAERRRLEVDGEEAAGASLGSRGVRLMTIHQSKGLEWPVVFLPDLDRKFDSRDLTAKALARTSSDDEGLVVACHPGDQDADDALGLKAGLIADHLRQRIQAEEARLFYVACTRAREELHALIPEVDLSGPLRDGSVRCPADWLAGAGQTWDDVVIALDGTVERMRHGTLTSDPLPALKIAPAVEKSVVSVGAQIDEHSPVVTQDASLSRSTAQALGIAIHQVIADHGPGMSSAIAEAVLAPFASGLGDERHRRLLTHLTDANLLPGYWSAAARLTEQPVIGEVDGNIVIGICDVLLQDANGAWHLYDWKTGEAATAESSHRQVQLYARLIAPYLNGPLVSAGLVDVESGKVIPVEIPNPG
jgi:ATP-dependent helicase/nuclease subunit A